MHGLSLISAYAWIIGDPATQKRHPLRSHHNNSSLMFLLRCGSKTVVPNGERRNATWRP